jgi:hypothetical protein
LEGFKNLIGPVIRLRRLSDDELLALIRRITRLYANYYGWEARITDEEQVEFLRLCLARAGADSMITPREMLRDYMTVLNILMQNPEADFARVVGQTVQEGGANQDNDAWAPTPSETKSEERHRPTAEDLDF